MDRASDFMMAPTLSYSFQLVGIGASCHCFAHHFSFAPSLGSLSYQEFSFFIHHGGYYDYVFVLDDSLTS